MKRVTVVLLLLVVTLSGGSAEAIWNTTCDNIPHAALSADGKTFILRNVYLLGGLGLYDLHFEVVYGKELQFKFKGAVPASASPGTPYGSYYCSYHNVFRVPCLPLGIYMVWLNLGFRSISPDITLGVDNVGLTKEVAGTILPLQMDKKCDGSVDYTAPLNLKDGGAASLKDTPGSWSGYSDQATAFFEMDPVHLDRSTFSGYGQFGAEKHCFKQAYPTNPTAKLDGSSVIATVQWKGAEALAPVAQNSDTAAIFFNRSTGDSVVVGIENRCSAERKQRVHVLGGPIVPPFKMRMLCSYLPGHDGQIDMDLKGTESGPVYDILGNCPKDLR